MFELTAILLTTSFNDGQLLYKIYIQDELDTFSGTLWWTKDDFQPYQFWNKNLGRIILLNIIIMVFFAFIPYKSYDQLNVFHQRNQSINWPFNLDLWWLFFVRYFPNYLLNELQPLCSSAYKTTTTKRKWKETIEMTSYL